MKFVKPIEPIRLRRCWESAGRHYIEKYVNINCNTLDSFLFLRYIYLKKRKQAMTLRYKYLGVIFL